MKRQPEKELVSFTYPLLHTKTSLKARMDDRPSRLKLIFPAAQIAERVGLSKTAVLERLRQQGIRNLPDRRTNPNNYRTHEPPNGFRKQEGRLIPYKLELKVCRIVVQMYEKEMHTYSAIGRELELKGYKNRRGETRWSHGTVSRIYHRWKGKL